MEDVLNFLFLKSFFGLDLSAMVKENNTPSDIRNSMLSWYDDNARDLPWRSKLFNKPDPYHIWMSEVMLQQTTVQAVIQYFEKFITIWPTIESLAASSQEDVMREWAGLGYYSRARNLYKCAITIVDNYDGEFPRDVKTLKTLPGIGDYTSAAIASIAFDKPSIVIDGNIERVISRLYRITKPLPSSKPIIRNFAEPLFIGENVNRPSCFAQSLMDLGATICTPQSPKCNSCPISGSCEGYKVGDANLLPVKKKKVKIPEKQAVAYIYIYNNQVGIETRDDKGMLGGMIGFPTSEWVGIDEKLPDGAMKSLKIRHVFTHFALTLYPVFINKKSDRMIDMKDIETIGLPTLFKKLWNVIRFEL